MKENASDNHELPYSGLEKKISSIPNENLRALMKSFYSMLLKPDGRYWESSSNNHHEYKPQSGCIYFISDLAEVAQSVEESLRITSTECLALMAQLESAVEITNVAGMRDDFVNINYGATLQIFAYLHTLSSFSSFRNGRTR